MSNRALDAYSFQSTPLRQGETQAMHLLLQLGQFQSTPLRQGETAVSSTSNGLVQISIHSPQARGDYFECFFFAHDDYFNPLPSGKGRPRDPEPAH